MSKKLLNDRIVATEIFGAAACNLACSYCVSGDTDILMSDFTTKEIKDIEIGDKVIGYKLADIPEFVVTEVKNINRRKDELYKIQTIDDNYISLTKNHPILSKTNKWYVIDSSVINEVNTKNVLNFGDKLKTFYNGVHSSVEISDIYRLGYDDVYNIQTGTENYVANGFVVHNCYIPKNKELNSIHRDVIENLKSGEFFNVIEKVYGKELTDLGSWGTEPTLTLPYYIPIFDQLLERFPKLETFSFSSNFMTNSEILIDLIKKVNDSLKDDRKFKLKFQISLDGPPEITNKNRKDGGEKLIIDNLHRFFDLSNNLEIKNNLNIELSWKPTWSSDNIRDFYENPSKLWGYFHYFDEVLDTFYKKNKNKKINLSLFAFPTLVVPGEYTKNDGLIYYDVMKKIYKISHDNKNRNIFKHYNGVMDSYYYRIKRLFDYEIELHNKPDMFTCSGGRSQIGLNVDGDVHLCHRTFYVKYDDYLKKILDDGKDRTECENIIKNKVTNAKDKYTANSDDLKELSRLEYIYSSYHDYIKFKMGATITNIFELADSGLILEKYKNYDDAYMLALLVNTGMSCPADNIMSSGNIHIMNSSLLKMFGNGALDLILEEINNEFSRRKKSCI